MRWPSIFSRTEAWYENTPLLRKFIDNTTETCREYDDKFLSYLLVDKIYHRLPMLLLSRNIFIENMIARNSTIIFQLSKQFLFTVTGIRFLTPNKSEMKKTHANERVETFSGEYTGELQGNVEEKKKKSHLTTLTTLLSTGVPKWQGRDKVKTRYCWFALSSQNTDNRWILLDTDNLRLDPHDNPITRDQFFYA